MNNKTQPDAMSKSHGYANETDKSDSNSDEKQLLQQWPVEGTPFTVIKTTNENNTEYWAVMGKYRLSELPHKTKEEAEQDAKSESWFRIMQVIKIMIMDDVEQVVKQEIEKITSPKH